MTAVTGTAFAVETSGELHEITLVDGADAHIESAGALADELPPGATLSTVGDDVVAFDAEGQTLINPYASMPVVGADSAVLQASGPEHSAVLISTADTLYAYPFGEDPLSSSRPMRREPPQRRSSTRDAPTRCGPDPARTCGRARTTAPT